MMTKSSAALQIQQPEGAALASSPRTVCPSGSDTIIDDAPPTLRDAMDYGVWVVGQNAVSGTRELRARLGRKAMDEALREFADAGHDGDILVEAIAEEMKRNPMMRRELHATLKTLIILALPRAQEMQIMERGLSCTEPLSQESLQHLVYAPAPETIRCRMSPLDAVLPEHSAAILENLLSGKKPLMNVV